ncbi:unnamed protein product [Nippostrongylus brasiliensis]|uniref:Zinc finger protein 781 (inferred by orthology to a human protein) n=1 Tax=Nippostrongylus brasiliensis TaxID=27835 RepID=A0A0N4YW67_NIPBR|nr:unnamed protein product [Nippostrongylus brasiliensis]
MSGYPVIFRCSECTIELPTLELLESHIWSRHLHNFPFSCAICRFPAIARTSLAAHFKQAHPPGQVGVFQNDTEADITVVDEGAILEEQHITRGSQVVHIDEDGATYFYDGEETGELLVDGASFDYQNVEGNSIYIEDSIPSTSKANNDVRMRLAKQRHIDFVVNKVARRSNGRTRRPLTIYECEDCGKIIRYPSKIEEHRRSHNGVKPHECPQCGQRFAQKGGLTCHMRLHTG